jgi:hypothetical protein
VAYGFACSFARGNLWQRRKAVQFSLSVLDHVLDSSRIRINTGRILGKKRFALLENQRPSRREILDY